MLKQRPRQHSPTLKSVARAGWLLCVRLPLCQIFRQYHTTMMAGDSACPNWRRTLADELGGIIQRVVVAGAATRVSANCVVAGRDT
jgi:hypothetical protein